MTRLQPLVPDRLDEHQLILYRDIAGGGRSGRKPVLVEADGSLSGPFNAMLHAPAVGSPLQSLGAALRFCVALSPREREIAVLAVGADESSDYEIHAHRLIAEEAGMSGEEVEELIEGRAPRTLSEIERLIHRTVRAMLVHGDLDDDQYDEITDGLGVERLVVLTTLVGYYRLLALQLRVFRVAAPESSER